MHEDMPTSVPRLCHIVKWTGFNGFGFNLHAEKGKSGQYIGKIDEGSPAEKAGLMKGDRIVEVNGTNISNENHNQVVSRIKAGGDETRLLVVNAETETLYKQQKKVVHSDSPEVLFQSSAQVIDLHNNHCEFTSEPHTTEVSADDVTENKMDNSDNYCPRLCNLCIWPDFTGYGFNMHAQKGVPGQYISSVDDNSPAIEAGLKAGDRIIDVNGDNIQSYAHTTVIQMIKSIPDRVRLLVVDKQTDEYYQSIGQIVYSAMPNVIVYYTKSRSVGLHNESEVYTKDSEASPSGCSVLSSFQPSNAESNCIDHTAQTIVPADCNPETQVFKEVSVDCGSTVQVESVDCLSSASEPYEEIALASGLHRFVAGDIEGKNWEGVQQVNCEGENGEGVQQVNCEGENGEGVQQVNCELVTSDLIQQDCSATFTAADCPEATVQVKTDETSQHEDESSNGIILQEEKSEDSVDLTTVEPAVIMSTLTAATTEDIDPLDNCSAAEMLQILKQRKKDDPRKKKTSFYESTNLFRKM